MTESADITFTTRARRYCDRVVSGEIIAGKWVRAACRRYLDDLADHPDYLLDPEEVERVCLFAEMMPHIKGVWARRRETIRLEDWQVWILASLFGWRKRSDSKRRFRTAYIQVARKNAKTTLLAIIGLYMLALDGEAGAEVYSAATTRDQAKIVFDVAKQMALREPEFRARFGVEVTKHTISIEESASKMEALSAEASNLDGLNVHGGIVDELHAHRTREVWDVLETATGSRDQSLLAAITTAGTNRAGICYEQLLYAQRLLNNVLRRHDGMGYRVDGDAADDETYFAAIYTIDDGDDWTDEACWVKANPNLGVSAYLDDLRRKARKAMQMASAAPNFLTKHLDVWVNADAAWMDMVAWQKAVAPIPDDLDGWRCCKGLDLASKTDIASFMRLYERDGAYYLTGQHFLPEDAVEESDNSQYRGWSEEERLTETPGNVIDAEAIIEAVKASHEETPGTIACDQGFGWDLIQRLENDGLPILKVSPTVINYSEPMKELEALVLSGRLKHDGNPVMTWMVSNVVCHRDAKDNIYPRKERPENKIDGVVAAILCLYCMMREPVTSDGFFTL